MSMSVWVIFQWFHHSWTSKQLAVNYYMTAGWRLGMKLVLCVIYGAKNGTELCHIAVYSYDRVFSSHFVALFHPHYPPRVWGNSVTL